MLKPILMRITGKYERDWNFCKRVNILFYKTFLIDIMLSLKREQIWPVKF